MIKKDKLSYIHFTLFNDDLDFSSDTGYGKGSIIITILIAINDFLKGFLKTFQDFPYTSINHLIKFDFILYSGSQNNNSVLKPLRDKLNSSIIISFFKFGEARLNRFSVYLLSFFFLPYNVYLITFSKGNFRKAISNRFLYFWLSQGYYLYLEHLLKRLKKKKKNKVLVIANDHESKARTLLLISRKLNLTTVYIQHASISPYFPVLDFNYAFLDGYDSLQKYSQIGASDTTVFLTGSSKYDSWDKFVNNNRKIGTIAICTNEIDDPIKVRVLLELTQKQFPAINFIVRPHPNDKRINEWKVLSKELGVDFSNSKKEIVFDFLKSIDCLIACETNIHLEAALLNILPIYFNFQTKKIYDDVYGFIKSGLILNSGEDPHRTIKILKKYINNRPNVRKRTGYYSALVGSAYEGNSTKLMTELLEQIKTKSIDYSKWERCLDINNIKAYRLKGTLNYEYSNIYIQKR